jgi:hypothetical protein
MTDDTGRIDMAGKGVGFYPSARSSKSPRSQTSAIKKGRPRSVPSRAAPK